MIPRSLSLQQGERWQQQLAAAVTDPAELLTLLGLDPALAAGARRAGRLFDLRVPHGFIARMRRGDPADPLLRQVLPLDAECRPVPGFTADPLQEGGAMPVPGLLHKYRGRALLTVTGACAVHCRYCFRRHFPYAEANPAREGWRPALEWLAGHADIHEVILSGGDPLSLGNRRLAELGRALEAIPHLRRLRIHSRLPVVLPARVDDGLLAWLSGSRLQTVVVLHTNHGNEIDAAVAAALRRLGDAGVTLLNQSVLLRGVNDSAQTLAELGEALFAAGALPYYLHQLDPVDGAAHFAVADDEALALHRALAARLPGYLVPRLVRELPGRPGKTLLAEAGGGTGSEEM